MTVGAPLDRLSTDILGPLPETPRGNRYILTATDHFTNWVEIFPVTGNICKQTRREVIREEIAGNIGKKTRREVIR